MKRTVLLFFAVFVGVPSTFSSSASMNGLNTAEIVQYTTEAINDCLQWKLVGQCFWLHCGLTGCEIRTSPKVSHYRPDLVVAVQLEHQELAWIEMNELLEASRQLALVTIVGATSPYSVEGGGVPATIRAGSRRSLRFYEADVFGHPLESMPAQQVLFCDGITQALRPYYQSVLDAIAWREPLLDISLQSLNPLGTNVGVPTRCLGIYQTSMWLGESTGPLQGSSSHRISCSSPPYTPYSVACFLASAQQFQQ